MTKATCFSFMGWCLPLSFHVIDLVSISLLILKRTDSDFCKTQLPSLSHTLYSKPKEISQWHENINIFLNVSFSFRKITLKSKAVSSFLICLDSSICNSCYILFVMLSLLSSFQIIIGECGLMSPFSLVPYLGKHEFPCIRGSSCHSWDDSIALVLQKWPT